MPVILTPEYKFCENKVVFIFIEVKHTEKYTEGRFIKKMFLNVFATFCVSIHLSVDTQGKKLFMVCSPITRINPDFSSNSASNFGMDFSYDELELTVGYPGGLFVQQQF